MDKVITKLLFKRARLIRRPFNIRGKQYIEIGNGFTTGVGIRLEAVFHEIPESKTLIIGKNVQINDHVHIAALKRVIIGNNVLIASNVFITDHNHGVYKGSIEDDNPNTLPKDRKIVSKDVVIEDNVWIGEFVSILPGVTIAKGSIIGTMSVVNNNIPPYSIAVGIPAKVIKRFNFDNRTWEKVG
ncbi:MAG: acetyltransferase [Salinivirgaceae bacterium]